jgi:hypothetical protein
VNREGLLEEIAREIGLDVLGRIPYDKKIAVKTFWENIC